MASGMAGLGLFDPKNAIAATTPVVTALTFCARHRKNGLLKFSAEHEYFLKIFWVRI
jgi:hypothetical protein